MENPTQDSALYEKISRVIDVIARLKYIGKMKKGEKMDIERMGVHLNSSYTDRALRTVSTESRRKTLKFIEESVNECFDLAFDFAQSDETFKIDLCQKLIDNLESSKAGIQAQKETYSTDRGFTAQISATLEMLETRMTSLVSKNSKIKIKEKRKTLPPPPPRIPQ